MRKCLLRALVTCVAIVEQIGAGTLGSMPKSGYWAFRGMLEMGANLASVFKRAFYCRKPIGLGI